MQVHVKNGQVRFAYELHRVKVKVTGRSKVRETLSCYHVLCNNYNTEVNFITQDMTTHSYFINVMENGLRSTHAAE